MNLHELEISKLTDASQIPFALLVLADDEIQAIEKYIYQSDIFVARARGTEDVLGVMALLPLNHLQIEIKAIAVEPSLHNQGIGKLLIREARRIAIERGYLELRVGTADCAFKEISFYERCGFEKFGIKENFFIDNYTGPLYENGIRLRNMVMLRILNLKSG